MTDKEYLNSVWPEWSIEELIGKGSSGTVYKAIKKQGNIVSESAIKVIRVPNSEDELKEIESSKEKDSFCTYYNGIIDEFENEISVLESFKGTQNIVSIEDYQIVKNESYFGWVIFIRMELLTPLTEYLNNNTLSEKDVLKLGIDICSALELCSTKSIVHRDIKPENIFVNKFGSFKLGDFGISKNSSASSKTVYFRGSLNYIAPEILQKHSFDQTSDIYSLGILLYRLLNKNRFPFVASEGIFNPVEREMAFNRRLAGEALPAPSEASEQVSDIILHATVLEPSKRYPDVFAFKKDLVDAYDRIKTSSATARKKLHKKALLIGIPVFAALLAVVVLALSVHRHSFGEAYLSDNDSHWRSCNECSAESKHEAHSFSDITVSVPASHGQAGAGHLVCTVCGYVQTVTIPAEDHIFSETLSFDALNHWNECACGSKLNVSPHVFSEWNTVLSPSHSDPGEKERHCTQCAYSEKITIPPAEHSPSGTYHSNDAHHWLECSCGAELCVELHSFGDLITVSPATCRESGKGCRKCSLCGYEKEETIPQKEHLCLDEWNLTEQKHWRICQECSSVTDEGEHVFNDDGYCVYCSYSPYVSAGLEFTPSENGYTVTGIGSCSDDNIIIPAFYSGKKVTGIGNKAFGGCTNIVSVQIPDTVSSIGDKAFTDCSALASVNIPSGMQSFGSQLFYCCTSLTTVYYESSFIPQNDNNILMHPPISTVIFRCKKIPAYCCRNCSNIKSVVIESGTASIGFSAFYGCSGLTSVSLPDTLLEIEACAFSECTSLDQIELPSSLKMIGDKAFYRCSSLGSITLPSGLEDVGEMPFDGCGKLTSVMLQQGITEIWDKMFTNCSSLKNIVLPDGIDTIGVSAFENSGIEEIRIPYGVKTIMSKAFYCCNELRSVTLPDTVTAMEDRCFASCPALTEVTLPELLTSIPDNCFDADTALTELDLPVSITAVGKAAFRSSGIVKADIPEKVGIISSDVFADCQSLTEITLHSGLIKIEKDAFVGSRAFNRIIFDGTLPEWRSVVLEPDWCPTPENVQVDILK